VAPCCRVSGGSRTLCRRIVKMFSSHAARQARAEPKAARRRRWLGSRRWSSFSVESDHVGAKQRGRGTVDSWLWTCIGPLGPNDSRRRFGAIRGPRSHVGLPLYLPWRRPLKSLLAPPKFGQVVVAGSARLTVICCGSTQARRHRPYLSEST
jgi:hypothetical protein